ncbi:helix-turn-helix domain-containing protein [Providencia rettgeri]
MMESIYKHNVPSLSSARFNRQVGVFLRGRRVALGLTGQQLGQILHLSQQQISRYERGITSMTLHQLQVFMRVLAFSWWDFFNGVIIELEKEEERNKLAQTNASWPLSRHDVSETLS